MIGVECTCGLFGESRTYTLYVPAIYVGASDKQYIGGLTALSSLNYGCTGYAHRIGRVWTFMDEQGTGHTVQRKDLFFPRS